MIIPKRLFAIAESASKDDTRQNLAGVHVARDEHGQASLTVTDGHALIHAPFREFDHQEFPVGKDGVRTEPKPGFSATIPRAAWTEAGKNVPKSLTIPILNCALLEEAGDYNGHVRILSTDQEVTRVTDARVVEGEFPDYRQVIPYSRRTSVQIGLGGDLLSRTMKTMIAMSGRTRTFGIKFNVPTDEMSPVELRMRDDDGGEILGLVMPMRLDGTTAAEDRKKAVTIAIERLRYAMRDHEMAAQEPLLTALDTFLEATYPPAPAEEAAPETVQADADAALVQGLVDAADEQQREQEAETAAPAEAAPAPAYAPTDPISLVEIEVLVKKPLADPLFKATLSSAPAEALTAARVTLAAMKWTNTKLAAIDRRLAAMATADAPASQAA